MNHDSLLAELEALLVEHDRFVAGCAGQVVTSLQVHAVFLGLLERIADTTDTLMATAPDPASSWPRRDTAITRANQILGHAVFTADVVAQVAAGARRPARVALGRWFSEERVAMVAREAAAVRPAEG